MTIRRELLKSARGVAVALVQYIDRVLAPPEKTEPGYNEEQQREMSRKVHREMRRAGTRRWNQSRPGALKIPEWLERHEAIHGTKATLEFLQKLSRK